MKKFFLATILLCSAASAQFNGCQPGLCNGDSSSAFFPGIVPNGYDCNYSSGLYYPSQSGCGLTVSRTTTNGTATNLLPTSPSGFAYTTFGNNVARITTGSGVLVEEARSNFLLNSAVPVTQTTGSLATGTYTLWVNGAGSATMSSGTGTGCGTGAATQGNSVAFTITVAGTCTVTVAGALNAFQLELNPGAISAPLSLCVTVVAVCVRGADVVTLTTPPTFGGSFSQYVAGTPNVPNNYATQQAGIEINNNSVAQRTALNRVAATGNVNASFTGGTGGTVNVATSWAQNTLGKLAVSAAPNNQTVAFNGPNINSGTIATLPSGLVKVVVGSAGVGTAQWFNGYIARFAIWPTTAISSTQLQSIPTRP